MKKKLYCRYCETEFEKEIKSIKNIKNIECPKCKNIIKETDEKPEIITKTDEKVDDVANTIINIYFYFYLITSTISLIFYFTNHTNQFKITTIIIIIGILIDYILGYTRNLFGTLGLLISSVLGIYILKDTKLGIFLGITVCTFISSIIKLIINKILNKLFRKYG